MFGQKPKIRVDHLIGGVVKRKKYILEGNRILIKKGKGVRGDPSHYAEYDKDCFIYYFAGLFPFKRLKRKLFLVEDHHKCVSFHDKKVMTGKPDPKGYFEAGAIKNAGATLQTVKIPALFYLVVFTVIFLEIIVLLVVSGKIVIA